MASRLLALSLAATLLLPGALAQGPGPGPGSATAAPSAPEWLDGELTAAFDSLTGASLAGQFAVHKLLLQGSTYTAADLRQAYAAAGFLGGQEAFVQAVEEALRSRLQDQLQGALAMVDIAVVSATLDTASLAPSPSSDPLQPPVVVRFAGTAALDLDALGYRVAGQAIDEQALRTALDLGAEARLPYDLVAYPGWNVTFAFILPAYARVSAAEGGAVGADQRSATFAVENWRGASTLRVPAALRIAGRDAPGDAPSDTRAVLTIDLAGLEGLTLPGLLRGDLGHLLVHFDAALMVSNLRLADFPALQAQVQDRLPDALAIRGLNADGFRLAVDRGLLPAEVLDDVEGYLQAMAAERTAALMPGGVALEGGFAEGTLDPALVSAPLDGEPPLAYRVRADLRIPLGAQAARLNAAAGPVLFQRELTFPVPTIEGLTTTYRVMLPQGIAVSGISAEGADIERVTEGGREVLVVTPRSTEATASFTVAVTAEFVVVQFWYVFAWMFLLTALGVAFLLWRRRRRRRKAQALEQGPPAEAMADGAAIAAPAPAPDAPPAPPGPPPDAPPAGSAPPA